ncbi:MAG TPA: hypothetical protein VGA55_00840 [Bacteroidota bacterium]
MNLVWESVRLSVCRRCIDGDSHGACRLPTDEACPLEAHFPIVAETVDGMRSRSMQSYILSIRKRVCSQCPYGSPDACRRRDALECALERYAPLIVERIERMRVMD